MLSPLFYKAFKTYPLRKALKAKALQTYSKLDIIYKMLYIIVKQRETQSKLNTAWQGYKSIASAYTLQGIEAKQEHAPANPPKWSEHRTGAAPLEKCRLSANMGLC